MANLMDKECLLTVVLVIVAVVFLIWLFVPNLNLRGTKTEKFNGKQLKTQSTQEIQNEQILPEEYPSQEILPETQDIKNGPFVDVKTGSIMDGPGWENGGFEDKEKNETEGVPSNLPPGIPSNYYFLDDGAGGEMSIQHNLCSKSCCSDQYPTPFKQKYDPYVCNNKSKFVPNNYYCNNSFQDSGCLCLTKQQSKFISNRGGNGSEWF